MASSPTTTTGRSIGVRASSSSSPSTTLSDDRIVHPLMPTEKVSNKILKRGCKDRRMHPGNLSHYTLGTPWAMALLIHRYDTGKGDLNDKFLRHGVKFSLEETREWRENNEDPNKNNDEQDQRKGWMKRKTFREKKIKKLMIFGKKVEYMHEAVQALRDLELWDNAAEATLSKYCFREKDPPIPDPFFLKFARIYAGVLQRREKEREREVSRQATLRWEQKQRQTAIAENKESNTPMEEQKE